ncbi:hypothetical protein GW17_00016379 [Ensete ventricosum]|nr:hypothetical protein GW17_00016379 [Ensete ventricosum]
MFSDKNRATTLPSSSARNNNTRCISSVVGHSLLLVMPAPCRPCFLSCLPPPPPLVTSPFNQEALLQPQGGAAARLRLPVGIRHCDCRHHLRLHLRAHLVHSLLPSYPADDRGPPRHHRRPLLPILAPLPSSQI